jgi:Fe-Mn family superoxide dismutase
MTHISTLPDLAADPGALERHISGRIMELHHDKHHAAYVRGANACLGQLEELREAGGLAAIWNIVNWSDVAGRLAAQGSQP